MTLAELHDALGDTTLQNRVRAAMVRTAYAVVTEAGSTTNHAERLATVKDWLLDVNGHADEVQRYVCGAYYAANPTDSTATMLGMTDATLQGHVDASLSVFIAGA